MAVRIWPANGHDFGKVVRRVACIVWVQRLSEPEADRLPKGLVAQVSFKAIAHVTPKPNAVPNHGRCRKKGMRRAIPGK